MFDRAAYIAIVSLVLVFAVIPVWGATQIDVELRKAAADGDMRRVTYFIGLGGDVNALMPSLLWGYSTSLHVAVRKNQVSMVEFLLAQGAKPNIRGDNWRTPMHRAQSRRIVQLPIEKGASVDPLDNRYVFMRLG